MLAELLAVALSSIAPYELNRSFDDMVSCLTDEERVFLSENNLDSWEALRDYSTSECDMPLLTPMNSDSENHGDIIRFPSLYLDEKYPDYQWNKTDEDSTFDVYHSVPIEMQSSSFPQSDILEAIQRAGVSGQTNYGGCGPIAALGVLEYFSRGLGYEEILEDSSDRSQRVDLATEVLSNVHFSVFGNQNETLVWPWDYCSCINTVFSHKFEWSPFSALSTFTVFGGNGEYFWDKMINDIEKGMPVTVFTGKRSGTGPFAEHYFNVYGFEEWVGQSRDGGGEVTKRFLKARVNLGENNNCFCDADILNDPEIALIEYELRYQSEYSFADDDFRQEFVNEDGNGQYYFDRKSEPVMLDDGHIIYTSRLRCSYIENEYLVLSPNRNGAGTAYLEMKFFNNVSCFDFSASLWSDNEVPEWERFYLQVLEGENWVTYKEINMYELPRNKDLTAEFSVPLKRGARELRFLTTYSRPSGDRNKGRICLTDFVVRYN